MTIGVVKDMDVYVKSASSPLVANIVRIHSLPGISGVSLFQICARHDFLEAGGGEKNEEAFKVESIYGRVSNNAVRLWEQSIGSQTLALFDTVASSPDAIEKGERMLMIQSPDWQSKLD